jgi:hypothetical protein
MERNNISAETAGFAVPQTDVCNNNYPVTYIDNIYTKDASDIVTKEIDEVLYDISSGRYKELVEGIRKLMPEEPDKASALKSKLPVFYPSCILSGGKSQSNIVEYNPLVMIDFDEIKSEKELEGIRAKANNIEYTVATFRSPRLGLKVLVKTDAKKENHKSVFKQVCDYYSEALETNYDTAVKNINRACYVSYDPNLYFDCESKVFSYNEDVRLEHISFYSAKGCYNGNQTPEECWNFTLNHNTYANSKRNNFVHSFACNANRWGLNIEDALNEAVSKAQGLSVKEIEKAVESGYKNINEHAKFKKGNGGKPAVSAVSAEIYNENRLRLEEMLKEARIEIEPDNGLITKVFYNNLPKKFKELCSNYNDKERDYYLMSLLPAASSLLGFNVKGLYKNKYSYCNLYSMVIAPPASGKSVMNDARDLLTSLNEELREDYKGLIIPANVSSSKLYQLLDSNEGKGFICETEADTLRNALKQEWGNFSDVLRKGYNYEPLSLSRKMDDEDIYIKKSNLSVLLTCTPSQVPGILESTEDGLFSRFLLYYSTDYSDFSLNMPDYDKEPMEDIISRENKYFNDAYSYFKKHPLRIMMDKKCWDMLEEYFEELHYRYCKKGGEVELDGVIKRASLNAFRVAMLITAFKEYENNSKAESANIAFETMDAVTGLIDCVLKHTINVINILPKPKYLPSVYGNDKARELFVSLDETFTKKQSLEIANQLSITTRYLEDRLTKWTRAGYIIRVANGKYKKRK